MTQPSIKNKAQTSVELAIFGAIVIFIIGIIVRQAMGFGFQQNQTLKAMRLAMSLSYRYGGGLVGGLPSDGVTSRNSATVFFIEDRLSPSADKFGSIDRVPYVVGGRGAFSTQFFQQVEAGENYNLGVYDVFINGKHIPLMTSRFRSLCAPGECAPTAEGYIPLDNSNPDWENNCILVTPNDGVLCPAGTCSMACSASCGTSCGGTIPPQCDCPFACNIPPSAPYNVGCVAFYATVLNTPQSKDWCDVDCVTPGNPPGCCDTTKNLSANERFDLDRDGTSDIPAVDRDTFFWQWKKVYNYNLDKKPSTVQLLGGDGISAKHGKNMLLDVDGDLKEEQVANIKKTHSTGIILRLVTIDSQNGDTDFSYDTNDYNKYIANPTAPGVKPPPGLKEDTSIYTFIRDASPDGGTYMTIEEGKLFAGLGDQKQYIRTAQKKDSVDFIQRVFQLSNDTNRFCDSSGNPAVTLLDDPSVPNPVEACNSCFSSANIEKTCLDEVTLQLFVRSRVKDLHGRKWVTQTDADPSVDFIVPPIP